MRAVRGEPVPHTPVWFMRQAGRSLPEYRKLREGVGMLESCMDADLVTEITLQPVRRYGVDAAILFSDIVLPLKAVGVDLDIKPGVGPVVAAPVRTLEDVAAIPDLTPEHVPYVTQAVGRLVAELGDTPLIGFAGAPFTVASYLVEGGPSREHALTKAMMFGAPDVWDALMRKIAGHLGRLPRGAGRGRRVGGPALRLLGRSAHAGRLRGVRAAALGRRAGPGRRPRRAPHPLRRRDREPARPHGRGRAATSSASTGGPRSAPPSARSATAPCRATSTRPWSSPRPR